MHLRLGTRASALARWQANWVAAQLRQRGVEVLLTPIATTGDRQRGPIAAGGEQGVFTKEIQLALLDGRIDLAVHSLKDLPTAETQELCLAAVPERGEPGDVLVSARGASLADLPRGAAIGTGSPRRRAQLLHVRPDLQMKDVRGNIDTRLHKLDSGAAGYDALVLAEAGLRRLGFERRITQQLPLEIVLPAPGQGALALEVRAGDEPTHRAVALLDHAPSRAAVTAERAMLAALGGGCLAPVAGLAGVQRDRLTLIGRVLSRDGARRIDASDAAAIDEPLILGRRIAEALLALGAAELIRSARQG